MTDYICQQIQRAGGWIDFARYMELALYAPGLGYYAGGSQKFGAQGDFITAPEVSPLFAQTLAAPVAQVLAALDDGDILEFGAGSGIFASDLLLALEQRGQLPQRYYILELSAELRQRQHQTLAQRAAHLLSHVQWLDTLPEHLDAVVIANEVLDAMPVQRFVIEQGQIRIIGVAMQGQDLMLVARDATESLINAVQHIEQDSACSFTDGYQSEINFNLTGWMNSISSVLNQGAIFIIDYGYPRSEYYLPERSMGTLMCYYRHRAHDDALLYPGLQDITAFVDFTAVAEAAVAAGLDIEGFTSQAAFLMENGISGLVETQIAADPKRRLHLVQQMKTLLLPSEMGERFKVMGLSKNLNCIVPGFATEDMLRRL